MERCPGQAVLSPVGLAADNVIRDRDNHVSEPIPCNESCGVRRGGDSLGELERGRYRAATGGVSPRGGEELSPESVSLS